MDHDLAAAGVDTKGNPVSPPVVGESSGQWQAEQMVVGIAHLGTIPGIVKIALDILTWIAFICVCAGDNYYYPYNYWNYSHSAIVFMKFATCTLSITSFIHVNLYTTLLVKKIDIIWPKWELFYFIGGAVLLLIASSVQAAHTAYSPGLKAAAAFGFFAMFGFAAGAAVALHEWKKGANNKSINQIIQERRGQSEAGAGPPATVTTSYPPYQPPDPPPTYSQSY